MNGRDPTRRRVLQTGTAAVGTIAAGCLLPRRNGSAATESTRYLEFEGVGSDFRRRTKRVYGRVAELVGRKLQTSTTVRLIDREEMRELATGIEPFGETTTQRLAHRALGLIDELEEEVALEFAGAYFPGSRSLTLVGSDAAAIDDQLLAHELLHAIQFQAGDMDDWTHGWTAGFDRYEAQQSLVEGAAQFLEDAYVGGCDGQFSSCRLKEPARVRTRRWREEWLLAYGRYVNGHDFAGALAERGGWDAIWRAHAAPPTHTGQVLRPEWYPDREPVPVFAGEPGGDWTTIGRERLGMQSTFVTLWLAGALPTSAAYAESADETDEVFSDLVRYRSPETDAWRGDEFAAVVRADGRRGWVWRIRWADTRAAEEAYELFRAWADERGEPTSAAEVWTRGDRAETLALDGEDLLVGSAPEPADFGSLSPALVE